MSSGFVKLYGSLLDSSVWGEPLATRIVWITMLAMSDKNGTVAASSDGIARRANVQLRATEAAIAILEAPDSRSKSPEHEGRRVERIDGGYRILNYMKYRELQSDKQKADAVRQQRHRDTARDTGVTSHSSHRLSRSVAPDADADAKAEAVTTKATALTDSSESGPVSKNGRKPRPDTPKYPHFPTADSARFHQTCLTNGFVVDAGLLRKTLAPLYPVAGPIHPADSLDNALIAFLESRGSVSPDKARFWTIMQFAADIGRWVRLGAMPRQDPFSGAPTERGMLLAGDS